MPRSSRNALSATMVRSAGPGNYVNDNGLMLRVRKSGSRQWIQRVMIHGRRVDLGLVELQGLGAPARRGRTTLGVRAGEWVRTMTLMMR